MSIDQAILVGGALLAAALILSALAGGVLAALAVVLGLHMGVRIRQGFSPVPDFRNLGNFLEEYVHGRKARAENLASPNGKSPKPPADETEEDRKLREDGLRKAGLRVPVKM